MSSSVFKSSIASVVFEYDAFILDLWGVIHDGQKLYPGAKECLERLRAAGKKIVLLSNAPRRAATVAAVLDRMGVSSNCYDAIVTSGETAYQFLAHTCHPRAGGGHGPDSRLRGNDASLDKVKGNTYFYIGLEKDQRILEGLHYKETHNPAEANFVLLAHPFYDNQPEAEIVPILEQCLKAKLPALCINPDMEVVRQTGERVYCAGVVAANYEALGGKVIYFGKPHPIVYQTTMKVFGDIGTSRILAVGDNLATDIKGAKQNHIASMLVTGGILQEVLGEPGTDAYRSNCAALFAQNVTPDFVVPAFNW